MRFVLIGLLRVISPAQAQQLKSNTPIYFLSPARW